MEVLRGLSETHRICQQQHSAQGFRGSEPPFLLQDRRYSHGTLPQLKGEEGSLGVAPANTSTGPSRGRRDEASAARALRSLDRFLQQLLLMAGQAQDDDELELEVDYGEAGPSRVRELLMNALVEVPAPLTES